ncbi:hypothetical protein [Catellatospora sp. IY07-71]|uniref:hypothetical protein n=1 Tax=Catellatospora sp. IY07-71 TaxID=2728827 RepID=UPI001BB33F3D|nr:hypothetical protein [Catellatospora sp. IY07-71]
MNPLYPSGQGGAQPVVGGGEFAQRGRRGREVAGHHRVLQRADEPRLPRRDLRRLAAAGEQYGPLPT